MTETTAHHTGASVVWKGSFRAWLLALGPTAILASVAMGPGTIGSNLAAGSSVGYDLAWLVVLSAAMSVINLYTVGKISAVTGLSLLEQFSKFYHPAVSWVVGSVVLITQLLVIPFTGVTLGHTLNFMFPSISPFVGMALCYCVIIYVYVFGGGFRFVSILCTTLVALMSAAFLVNAIVVGVELPALVRGIFVPRLPQGQEQTLLALGILGGSMSVIGSLMQGYSVKNARWTAQQIPVMAWDATMFTGLLFVIFSMGILISGVALEGKPVQEAAQAATALEPIAGPAARWIFALGYFIAIFTTLAAISYLGGYIIYDFLKWPLKVEIHKDLRFRVVCTLVLATVFLAPLFTSLFPPIYLIIFGTALFSISTPPVLLLTLILARRESVMGNYRIGTPLSIFLAFSVIASFSSGYVLVVKILSRMG